MMSFERYHAVARHSKPTGEFAVRHEAGVGPQPALSHALRQTSQRVASNRLSMDDEDAKAARERAEQRRTIAWTRVLRGKTQDADDPDEAASTASERFALVDHLLAMTLEEVPDPAQRRLQRSFTRIRSLRG